VGDNNSFPTIKPFYPEDNTISLVVNGSQVSPHQKPSILYNRPEKEVGGITVVSPPIKPFYSEDNTLLLVVSGS